jgi:D-inositol-3-phosphate glycosyltransferase
MAVLLSRESKPTVLAVGLFVPGTGFTRVFESLFATLSEKYTLHWLGIGYKGEIVQTNNYILHPCNVNGGDLYGAYGAAAIVHQVKAQSVLLLTDFYLLKNYEEAWRPLKESGVRLLAYIPLDGEITDISIIRDCLFLDDIVMYASWAAAAVATAFKRVSTESKSTIFPRLTYIYHGVNLDVFEPAANSDKQDSLKKEIFLHTDAADSIFILNANRFNERKDLESTITAFAAALPNFNKPAYLCLHTPNLQPELKTELIKLIEKTTGKDRVIVNPLGDEYISDNQLVRLYQACDVGVNTSLGEGWGLITFEHAACGAAQIVPGHTTPAELWQDAALITATERAVTLSTNPFQMHAISKELLSEQLITLVNEPLYLAAIGDKCRQRSTEKIFNWNFIGIQWQQLLK